MNIQQLEYIVAVEEYQHFGKAAEHCRVTQPTLSMMIQKLEEELDIKLFDRSVQPVRPTSTGTKIIEQARKVLHQVSLIKDISRTAYRSTLPVAALLSSIIKKISGYRYQNAGNENFRQHKFLAN